MQEYFNIELKETFNGRMPGAPRNYPLDSNLLIGISYQGDSPKTLIMPDIAYGIAIEATYHRWFNEWIHLGNAEELLKCIVQVSAKDGYKDWAYSWPEPFPNHYTFNCPESYQINPVRELLRRHFDQKSYMSDRDIIIETTYRRERS